MIKLSELDTWCVEQARGLLDEIWEVSDRTEDPACDFGRLKVHCRWLLEVIDRMTGRPAV